MSVWKIQNGRNDQNSQNSQNKQKLEGNTVSFVWLHINVMSDLKPLTGFKLFNRCQVNIGIPQNMHPGCLFFRKNGHPDVCIYVNIGIWVPIFTVNMSILL